MTCVHTGGFGASSFCVECNKELAAVIDSPVRYGTTATQSLLDAIVEDRDLLARAHLDAQRWAVANEKRMFEMLLSHRGCTCAACEAAKAEIVRVQNGVGTFEEIAQRELERRAEKGKP
jgi:hypothetical protein